MRILITGASGFIGRHLATRLLAKPDSEVLLLVRDRYAGSPRPAPLPADSLQGDIFHADLRNFEQVQTVLNQVQPEIIFHLAAAGVGNPFLPVEEALSHNLYGTLNLLRAAFAGEPHTRQPQQLVIGRTPGEYSAMNPYAASKAAAWQFCRMYARTLGWPIVGAAIFQAYGPGQLESRVLPSAINAALSGQDFPMTAGKQERDWIYVSDVVAGLLAVWDAKLKPGSSVDLGSGELTSVATVVQRIYTTIAGAGRPLIGAVSTRPGEEMLQRAKVDKAFDLTAWRTAITLENGLAKTIEFHKNPRNLNI